MEGKIKKIFERWILKLIITIFGSVILILTLAGCTSLINIPVNSLKQERQIPEPVKSQTENIEEKEGSRAEIKNDETQLIKAENFYLVTRVIDGDTIEIENGETVRYIGINAPESIHPSKPVECFGQEATFKNEELVLGKKVRLEKDITDKDRYGRLLRYVYVDDLFVNLELLKQGYANVYTYPPDVKYVEKFKEAEKEAREAGRGLWVACSRKQVSNCLIKGNINSKGEKIYHLPGCPYYNQTKVDEARGEKWFCSEKEAIAAGWRKAKNCP